MALGWYSELNPVEKRTYWACFAGLALDSMDHTIYALVIPALMATLGITAPEAGFLATAASGVRPSADGVLASLPIGLGASESCNSLSCGLPLRPSQQRSLEGSGSCWASVSCKVSAMAARPRSGVS